MNQSITKQIQQGLDLLKNDNWNEAVDYFKELRNQSFEEANIYYLESFALKEMNLIDESKKSLQMALKIDPQIRFNIQPLFNQDTTPIVQSIRCIYLISENKYPNAMFICDEILRTQPQYLPALFSKAQILFHQNKIFESHKVYDKILQMKNDYLLALLGKCQIFENIQNYQEALKFLQQAQKLHPLQKCIYFQKSKILEMQNKIKESQFNYDLLLQIDKGDSQIYIKRGICLIKNKEFETAIWCFDKALTLAPDLIYDLTIKKGQALIKLKQYQEAIELFDKCIYINPQNYEGYLYKSDAFYGMKKYEAALTNCEIVLGLRQDIQEAYLLKGNILLKQLFSPEALPFYDYVIENFEDNFIAFILKCYALKILGEDDEIIQLESIFIYQVETHIEIIPKLEFELISFINDQLRTINKIIQTIFQSTSSEIYQKFISAMKQYNYDSNINDQEEEEMLQFEQEIVIYQNNYYILRSMNLKDNFLNPRKEVQEKFYKYFDLAIKLNEDNFQLKTIKYLFLIKNGLNVQAQQYFKKLLSEISQDILQIMSFVNRLQQCDRCSDALLVLEKANQLIPQNYYISQKKEFLESNLF